MRIIISPAKGMREDLDGTDLETYPLTRFLRAWDAGERRILVLQKGDES